MSGYSTKPGLEVDKSSCTEDPNFWEALLAREGYLTPEQEEAGVLSGNGSHPSIRSDWLDETDQIIVERLANEGDHHHYSGAPESMDRLMTTITAMRQELIDRGVCPDQIVIGVHVSCMTGDDCVVVSQRAADKYHTNTRNISDYSRARLARMLKESDIDLVDKDF